MSVIVLKNSQFAKIEEVYGDFHVLSVPYPEATFFDNAEEAKKTKDAINNGGVGIYSYISSVEAIGVFEKIY